jgi:hypothetical protein
MGVRVYESQGNGSGSLNARTPRRVAEAFCVVMCNT